MVKDYEQAASDLMRWVVGGDDDPAVMLVARRKQLMEQLEVAAVVREKGAFLVGRVRELTGI